MKQFDLDIYTPFGHYLSDKIDSLSVRSEEYSLGILADHAPLISTVTICQVVIEKDGKKEKYATSGGIIKIKDNQVDLLLETIESVDEIDLSRALAAKERAENRLASGDLEPLMVTRSRLALARAINRINLKEGKD